MGDDVELLRRWHGGDKTAGNELFARHFPALRRFFRNKVGHEEAEDLIQRTMLETVRSAPSFRGEASFRTFIFTIARRELCHHIRRKHRKGGEADLDFSVSSLEALGTSPSGLAAQRQDHQRILAALRAIPLDFQITLELHYWEQLEAKELAEVLGIARARCARGCTARAQPCASCRVPRGAPPTEDLESSITAARPGEPAGNAPAG
ncbi:MAG: RNA polymerase sigma factor [Nannocystaceae bacterium]